MRVALVMGGASGIGVATAQALAVDGFKVGIADLAGEAAKTRAAKTPSSRKPTPATGTTSSG